MTAPFVHAAPRGVGIEGLEAALLEAFQRLREALTAGRPAVVIVRDADLLGHGDPADAALANGLLGLVRALATEGAREQWIVNALAVDGEETDEAAQDVWVQRLSEPVGVTGVLIRLGDLHLGRVPV
ncbi:MAG: hypothetical protein JO206_12025 [Solirubrobacterales bacterium]|nr:hypothetical protein [Solirubrobacterales bacterium]MBV9473687.1 hypothetical protein [Solirubrobacterales bacterium]MBV9836962.1 hypothetical protein [Solirubrobacterales bacterium]